MTKKEMTNNENERLAQEEKQAQSTFEKRFGEEEAKQKENAFSFDTPSFNIDLDINLENFDFTDSSDGLDNRYTKPRIYKQLTENQIKYNNARKLARDTLIGRNQKVDVLVSGNFIFGDFIEAYFVEHQIHTERLVVSTLSMNQNNVDSLKTLMLKGYVDKIDLIISNYFFANERNNLIRYAYKELDYENRFQLAVVRSHTKTVLFETRGGHHIVMNGSANLRSSNNIETFTLEDSKETYDFHMEYSDMIIEKYKTINKPVGAKDLWDTVKDHNK